MTRPEPLALAHDYLTQRGGAERVVLALASAHPTSTIYTSLFDPDGTFPEFSACTVQTLPINRVKLFRDHHRAALPLLAPAFSRLVIDAEVAICSSSGWAHGARVLGRKVVYCHTPARWLYQGDRYLAGSSCLASVGLSLMAPALRRWDRGAAASAHRYLVNSRAVRDRVSRLYGIEAEVVPPPVDLDVSAPSEPVPGLEPGYFLCVSRLLPYKNVEAVVEAFALLADHRLVGVGSGPLRDAVAGSAPSNVTVIGHVSDARLRWLYASSAGLVAASFEDFGLTPVEAASFGKPAVALRWGGFLDTTVEGVTGVFFDRAEPTLIARAVERAARATWDPVALVDHAGTYSTGRFLKRIDEVVDEERGLL